MNSEAVSLTHHLFSPFPLALRLMDGSTGLGPKSESNQHKSREDDYTNIEASNLTGAEQSNHVTENGFRSLASTILCPKDSRPSPVYLELEVSVNRTIIWVCLYAHKSAWSALFGKTRVGLAYNNVTSTQGWRSLGLCLCAEDVWPSGR